MARLYGSFRFFLASSGLGWLILNGHDPRPDSQPWWRNENRNAFWYDTIDALVAYFGPTPVGLFFLAAGPVLFAVIFFVVKPRTAFRRPRWRF